MLETGGTTPEEIGLAPQIASLAITGVPVAGAAIEATPGQVLGVPGPVIAYTWYRDNGPLPIGTGNLYDVTLADVGQTITLQMVATNNLGTATASASVVGTSPTTPLGPTSTPTSGTGPGTPTVSGTGTPSASDIAALLAGEQISYTPMTAAAVSSSGWEASDGGALVNEAWDYLRTQVGPVLTNLEGAAEAVAGSALETGTAVTVTEIGAGVTADILGLPEVLFAAALLLIVSAFGWLEQFIARWIPNPGIFGFHPLGFIQKGISDGGKSLQHQAMGITDRIANVFIQPVRQIVGIVERLLNGVAGAHNKAATLAGLTIPEARHDAVVTAENFTKSQMAIIQGAAAQALAMLDPPPSEAQAKAIIATALGNDSLVWVFEGLAASAIVAADELTNQKAADLGHAISTTADQVATNAATALSRVQSNLVTRLQDDEAAMATLATTVNTQLPAEIATKVNDATAAENNKLKSATNTINGQITHLQGEIDTLTTTINTAQTNIAMAQVNIAALQQSGTAEQSEINANEQSIAANQVKIAASQMMLKDLNTTITGISSQLAPIHAAQQLNTAQLAPFETPGAIVLPTVIATLSSTLRQLKNKVDTCTVDTCNPQSPQNIRNVLRDLFGLMTAAGEIGFIAEAVRDPLGTADALSPFLEGIDGTAVGLLNALLSL